MIAHCLTGDLVKYQQPADTLNYKFGNGCILTEDIISFGLDVAEMLKGKEFNFGNIVVDISESDDFCIKPPRFFETYSNLKKRVFNEYNNIKFLLKISERQSSIFEAWINSLSLDVIVSESTVVSKPAIGNTYFALPISIMTICFIVFFFNVIFVKNDLLQFVLGISSGVLLYEGYLLLGIYKDRL